jgi:hypothetical protein
MQVHSYHIGSRTVTRCYCPGSVGGSALSVLLGYNRPNRSIRGRASGVLSLVGSLTGWSQTSVWISVSMRRDRMVDTQASSVSSVPPRRSRTRSLGFVGGASVWMSDQHWSKILRRRSSGTLMVLRSAVQRAVTKSTNCKSGIPGCWTSRDCICPPLSTEIGIESILATGSRTGAFHAQGVSIVW